MDARHRNICVVAFWLSASANAAHAQVSPLVPEGDAPTARTALQRVIRDGCSPRTINDAMRTASFDNLADWLERQGRTQESQRIRAISDAERREFLRNEAAVTDLIVAAIEPIGKGDRWDAGRNLATATALLGGADGLTRYVAAARDAQLEIYKRPSAYFFETPNLDLATWVRTGAPGQGMTSLPNDLRYTGTRGSFEMPFQVSRYLLKGVGFGAPYTIDANTSVAVNTAALASIERTRAQQSEAIRNNPRVPLRGTLAAKMADKPDTTVGPVDESDTALTYAAWLPNLCIAYQQAVTPLYFSQKAIDDLYIRPLKTNGSW
jgi:hypothetical protein